MEHIDTRQTSCKFCNKNAKQKCSRCQNVYYCNKECQASHYKTHKLSCKQAFKIVEIAGKGKGMIADKFITEGSLIFSESPLLISPVITEVQEISSHVDKLHELVSNLDAKKKQKLFSLYNARPDLQLLGLFGSNSIR